MVVLLVERAVGEQHATVLRCMLMCVNFLEMGVTHNDDRQAGYTFITPSL